MKVQGLRFRIVYSTVTTKHLKQPDLKVPGVCNAQAPWPTARPNMTSSSITTDVVLVDAIQLSANVGADCWGRSRNQPVTLSVYLHLQPSFLDISGQSDDVADSIHYGHLTKDISTLSESSYDGIRALISDATTKSFHLMGKHAEAVRIVVGLPKLILLAGGFEVELITPTGQSTSVQAAKVFIKDLVMPVLIGVNPPERLAKQRVVTNITFHERSGIHMVDYPAIVKKISEVSLSSSTIFVGKLTTKSCL